MHQRLGMMLDFFVRTDTHAEAEERQVRLHLTVQRLDRAWRDLS